MSDRKLAEQLESLGTKRAGGSPDAQWLLSARETLMMQVSNTVREPQQTGVFASFASAVRLFAPDNLGKWAAVPALVLALMVGSNLGASAIVAAASQTLPGDTLYNVKLAAEKVTLKFATNSSRVNRRLEVAARRMDEMSALVASRDAQKDEKIARVAGLFSDTMNGLRADLSKLESGDASSAVRAAVAIDARSDDFQMQIQHSGLRGRESFRVAQVNLDQVSVEALELIVLKHSDAPTVLADAELSSTVGRGVQRFVAQTEAASQTIPYPVVKKAAQEAQELFTQGEFRAAVRKIMEGNDLINNPEESASSTENATSTPDVSATGTEPAADL